VHARFGRGRPETYRREPARRRAPTLRDHAVEAALVAVHAHEAVGEDAAALEGPELALDEARCRPLAGMGAGQKRLELRLDRLVQHARFGAALCVALCFGAAGRGTSLEKGRCLRSHPAERLRASYPSPGRSSARLRARSPGI